MAHYLIIDTETTGLEPPTAKVVEVAWLLINDEVEVVGEGHSLINPGVPIPPVTSAIHGIYDENVVDAPSLDEYMKSLELPSDSVFAGHQARFDWKFLEEYFPADTPQMCSLRLSRHIYKLRPTNHKLGTLISELGINLGTDDFHSADVDVLAVLKLLERMMEDEACSLQDLHKLSNTPLVYEQMPFGKFKGRHMSELPKDYVAWCFYGAGGMDPEVLQSLRNAGWDM